MMAELPVGPLPQLVLHDLRVPYDHPQLLPIRRQCLPAQATRADYSGSLGNLQSDPKPRSTARSSGSSDCFRPPGGSGRRPVAGAFGPAIGFTIGEKAVAEFRVAERHRLTAKNG